MTYRIMLRERGRSDWKAHNGPFEERDEAFNEAVVTVTGSGFDAFQVWKLVDQQELVSQFVQSELKA